MTSTIIAMFVGSIIGSLIGCFLYRLYENWQMLVAHRKMEKLWKKKDQD